MRDLIEERKDDTPRGRAKRRAITAAMELKNYEFNAHGVEMGQFYRSSAVVPDGTSRPAPTRDPELYYEPSTVPGSPLPHAWVGDARRSFSTLDLAPSSRFTLFTGIAGQAWADAVPEVADRLGVPIEAVVIGPGRTYTDLYFDWERLRGIDEEGALLVRPDKIVAWRAPHLSSDPAGVLASALAAILSRSR